MLLGARVPPLLYTHPWDLNVEDRLKMLTTSEHRIAYFYETAEAGTFRYRVFNMVDAVNASPELNISASWFTTAELSRFELFIDRADALVLCRVRYDVAINRMVARAKARGLSVFYDIDDLVFDTQYTHLVIDTLDQQISDESWNHWFAYIGRIGATLRLCDNVIATNPFLAARAQTFAPWSVQHVVPNFLNRLQQSESERLMLAKRHSSFSRDNNIHVGYFSGSRTHNRDFEVVSHALATLLDHEPQLVLRIVGFLELKEPLLRYQDRIETYPIQDFVNLQRLVAEVEINIAPLQDNIFTNCKSELKFFEASIVGTLTIASPLYAFRNTIRDGENGFLATAQEWYSKLCTAIDRVFDTDQYMAITECAFNEAQQRYSWNRYARKIGLTIFSKELPELKNSESTFIESRSDSEPGALSPTGLSIPQ